MGEGFLEIPETIRENEHDSTINNLNMKDKPYLQYKMA